MSRAFSRSDRVAQMTKQEELIAKKRQEIIDRQKTSELGKAVAAAQINVSSSSSKMKKEEFDEILPPLTQLNTSKSAELLIAAAVPTPQNNFCNDGSFFEHFKKIIESNKNEEIPTATVTAFAVENEIIDEELSSLVSVSENIKQYDNKEDIQPVISSESGNNSDTNSNSVMSIKSGLPSTYYSSNSESFNNTFFNNDDSRTSSLPPLQQLPFILSQEQPPLPSSVSLQQQSSMLSQQQQQQQPSMLPQLQASVSLLQNQQPSVLSPQQQPSVSQLQASMSLQQPILLQQKSHTPQFNPNIPPPNMQIHTTSTPPPPITTSLHSGINDLFPSTLTLPPSLAEVRTAFQIHSPLPPPPPPPPESSITTTNAIRSASGDKSCDINQKKQEHHNFVEPKSILPTSVESLTKLVIENGDGYEEYLQSRKNDAHSSLW